jgi:hypothetical protein
MAYVVVASLHSSFTPSDGDCTVIQSLVELLSWTQVNDRAASAITTAKFFPLTTPYFKRVIDRLGSVVCGGSRALGDTAFLIGQGSSLQSVNDWVQAYSSDKFVLKYFTSNTVTALNSLAKGTLLLSETLGRPGSHAHVLLHQQAIWISPLASRPGMASPLPLRSNAHRVSCHHSCVQVRCGGTGASASL